GEAWPAGIDVLPASPVLAVREQDTWDGREHRLARACEGVLDGYDVVLWDLPPNVGQMTVNGLVAADEVWVVTDPTRYGLDGVALIMGAIDRVQRYHHPGLAMGQIVINMHEPLREEPRFRAEEIRTKYGRLDYDEELPRAEEVRNATGAAAPLAACGAEGRKAAEAVDRVAKRVLDGAVAWWPSPSRRRPRPPPASPRPSRRTPASRPGAPTPGTPHRRPPSSPPGL